MTAVDSTSLSFDANGNMTVDEVGNELTYDAWNRLVKVEDSGSTVLADYAYDALTRRIAGYGTDLYYSQNWQVLEDWQLEKDAPVARYVWSIAYIDALILRDWDPTYSGTYVRHYALCDANWNVTSWANLSAAIEERYIYDPYGLRTVLDVSWRPLSASAFDWVYGHQGGRLDVDAGLYSFRYRDLRPTIMRWMGQDPIGFRAGDFNLYRYVSNNPVMLQDPSGNAPPPGAPPPPKQEPNPGNYLCYKETKPTPPGFIWVGKVCSGTCTCTYIPLPFEDPFRTISWRAAMLVAMPKLAEACCVLTCGIALGPKQVPAMQACMQKALRELLDTPQISCDCT